MDKKFTPEEAVVTLRHCVNEQHCMECAMYPHLRSGKCTMKLCAAAADTIEALIEENKRLREENRWIPTSERLPDQELEAEPKDADGKPLLGGYECIAQIEGAKRPTALWYCRIDGEGVWTDESGENFYRVTHWKPMPKGAEAE